MRIVFTQQSELDFETIGDHIAEDNPDRATSFVVELREACLALRDYPRRYPMTDATGAQNIRRRNHRGYAVLYRVDDGQVTILRVMHGARDMGANDLD